MREFIKNTSIEKLFVILAIFFGFFYVFILPPFQSVDEGNHFMRVYQLSTGNIISKNISDGVSSNGNDSVGDYIPDSIIDYYEFYIPFIKNIDRKQNISNIKNDFQRKLNPEQKSFAPFANTSLYSPVCYLSQLPGVILAKVFTDNVAVIYYIGRLCNLIIYCLLVYYAIKIIPFFKLPLMLLSIMPMSVSLAASYTCDVAVFGLNFLWMALILKLINDNKDGIYKYVIGLVILAFLISLAKSYILLLPLCLLIPSYIFKNTKSYITAMACIIGSAVCGGILWYFSSKGLTLNMNGTVADSSAQIAFIMTHPIQYMFILLKTFIVKTPRLIITMIGVLGWQDTKLDWSTYILYPILFYLAIYADNYKYELYKWQKYLILFTALLGTIFTYTSLYVMWTAVGNGIILGLNGKYFIPMMLPLFLLFKNKNPKYDPDKIKLFVIIAIVLILATSELSLLHRFYNITPQLYYKI